MIDILHTTKKIPLKRLIITVLFQIFAYNDRDTPQNKENFEKEIVFFFGGGMNEIVTLRKKRG